MRGITYKCGKCLDASPTEILVKCLIYLTATNSIPSWSDMPHPAQCAHTMQTHTQMINLINHLRPNWQSNIQDSDWVEGDCDLFQICLACKANVNKHKGTVCMCRYKHTFVVFFSQVLVNKESQVRWSFAMLIPVVHMLSSSTVTQHCSCTILSARDKTQNTDGAFISSSVRPWCKTTLP